MLYDVVVVGGGIAGLYAALYARRTGASVALLTKSTPFRSNSAVASGGINAVLYAYDSDTIAQHVRDTVEGSDGLAAIAAISKMCQDAPNIVQELETFGVNFDKREDGTIAQRPFGGTLAKRTCYIADKTGAAIVQKLFMQCREEGVEILSNHMALDITSFDGRLSGVTVLRRSDSHVLALACKSLVLAGGGFAGIYRGHTTNPQESSGDTIAMALRAGMRLSNMEFVQFHPTTLAKSGALISEAARGEGGYLVDEKGMRFTQELATRDKLSRAIVRHIEAGHQVYLDMRHIDEKVLETKLPHTRSLALNSAGIDISKELLPIAPAAHYTIGGIATRLDTSTDMEYVFAAGECAATGVHGANRLGGNSLLEAAYFGRIAGLEAAKAATKRDFAPIDYATVERQTRRVGLILKEESRFNINAMRKNLGETLFRHAGVFRDAYHLSSASEYIHYLVRRKYGLRCVDKDIHNNVELAAILEFFNALEVAQAMVMSALARQESRGVHYREDYQLRDDKRFAKTSYLIALKEDFYKVTFDAARFGSWRYKFKKWFSHH
ncbi:MAG: hypothetical protein KU37_05355 [Sulfuricurvum sp. PC08-66]|nr:MAG: hypothetical protein KU37_05355 [Sulfuricurvum sp. PC08-66]